MLFKCKHMEKRSFKTNIYNELASVAPDGRRRWVYARKPSGAFYRWRTRLSWVLLAFHSVALTSAPFTPRTG